MVLGTITVDAVRAQLVKLGRHDVSDARIEEFLQQRPTRRAAREDDDNESVATTTTTTTTAITTSDEEYEIEHAHMNDSRHRDDGTRNKMTRRPRRRPPWNGDAFELLSLRATTEQTRVYPRRKAHEGDEIGKVDVVKLGAEYRKVWSTSPLLSGAARPKVGFAEKFAALHEAERLKSLERKRRQDISVVKISTTR